MARFRSDKYLSHNKSHNKFAEIRLFPLTCFCSIFAAFVDAMRTVKTIPRLLILLLTVVLLASCASTDFQPVESQGPLVGQGQWGTRKVVYGVDIWTMGAPPRKYRVLGVISDTRGARTRGRFQSVVNC